MTKLGKSGFMILTALLCGCSEQESVYVSEFRRAKAELRDFSCKRESYRIIQDANARQLREKHERMREVAFEMQHEFMLSQRVPVEQWSLVVEWSRVMHAESERLNIPLNELVTDWPMKEEIERVIAIGLRIDQYTEKDVVEIRKLLEPELGCVLSGISDVR